MVGKIDILTLAQAIEGTEICGVFICCGIVMLQGVCYFVACRFWLFLVTFIMLDQDVNQGRCNWVGSRSMQLVA
jgi:hypothetical protein